MMGSKIYNKDLLFQIWSNRDLSEDFYKQRQVTEVFTINKQDGGL